MSYTSAEQVRHHLATEYPILDRVMDQFVVLPGIDDVSFFGGPVDDSDMFVKSLRSESPLRQSVALTSGAAVITSLPLVRGSVLVASDSSLATVYTENLDYIIDYGAATVSIKTGGTLSSGQNVSIWYRPFTQYLIDVDYKLDASRGRLKRLSGGAIADGETVLLDFTPLTAGVTDEIIADSVVVANGLIESQLDPNGQFTSSPSLSAAATFRALEIISRAAAARELSSRRGNDKTALAWMRLASEYSERSVELLSVFRPPLEGPSAPVHS